MFNILREIRVLREEGKLHRTLIVRTRILLLISVVLASIVLFNMFYRGTDWMLPGVLAIIGLVLGLFIFSRMNPIQWNEEREVVETG